MTLNEAKQAAESICKVYGDTIVFQEPGRRISFQARACDVDDLSHGCKVIEIIRKRRGPYRPHSDKYFETIGVRFSERTIRRHWPTIMRGIVNRDLREAKS